MLTITTFAIQHKIQLLNIDYSAGLRKTKRKRLRSGSNWIHKTLFKQGFSQQNPLANATQKRVRFRFATVDIWHDWSPLRDEAERSQKTEEAAAVTFAC